MLCGDQGHRKLGIPVKSLKAKGNSLNCRGMEQNLQGGYGTCVGISQGQGRSEKGDDSKAVIAHSWGPAMGWTQETFIVGSGARLDKGEGEREG